MDFQTEGNSIVYKNADGAVLARVDFSEVTSGVYDIFHTEVDASLQGQGIAGKLVARAARWKVAEGCFVLVCGGLVEATCRERCIAIIGRTLWRHDCREENQ